MIKRLLLLPLLIRPLSKFKIIKRSAIAFGNGICCPSVTYVKKNIPLPLFMEGMKSNIDWEAWERLSKEKGRFCYINKLLMGHRIHNESTTTKIIESNSRGDEDYYMFKKFWPGFIAKKLSKTYSGSEKSNSL